MNLPDQPFYLLGMGNRHKFLYRKGELLDATTGQTVVKWHPISESISPADYSVHLETLDGKRINIFEDEDGVWIDEGGERACLSESPLRLPGFEGHRYAPLLRALHQELLINVVNSKPLPNFLVYPKPWYRDAAMICMCLKATDNLHLVRDWISGLMEPFDRNNAGVCEPDNLGQALYMISLVSDSSHPLVEEILKTVEQFKRLNHIIGLTDGSEHPVYQTKWLKFGLDSLGLDDPYVIPKVFDSYSSLFWINYAKDHVEGPHFSEEIKENYPYLGWAEAHFHRTPKMISATDRYPLSWEAHASEANYDKMGLISRVYTERRICAPHAWHAAEMFLYFLDFVSPTSC